MPLNWEERQQSEAVAEDWNGDLLAVPHPIFCVLFLWLFKYRAFISMSDDSSAQIISMIIMLFLMLVYTFCVYFNMIFDIVYVVKSHKFSENKMILWILFSFFAGIISAPIFWWIHLKAANPHAPLFPPKETA